MKAPKHCHVGVANGRSESGSRVKESHTRRLCLDTLPLRHPPTLTTDQSAWPLCLWETHLVQQWHGLRGPGIELVEADRCLFHGPCRGQRAIGTMTGRGGLRRDALWVKRKGKEAGRRGGRGQVCGPWAVRVIEGRVQGSRAPAGFHPPPLVVWCGGVEEWRCGGVGEMSRNYPRTR